MLGRAERRIHGLEDERDAHSGRDPVTGLVDLATFCVQLDAEHSRARRHDRALSVALLDVDGFRAINERHGRAVGDRVLAGVGDRLTRFLRTYDCAARAAGDEFAILLPETDAAGAARCLERVVLELEIAELGPVHGVTAAVGIAALEPDQSPMGLLDAAATHLELLRGMREAARA
jgi:diguanylate cyclase (GGDEF)-like protein